MKISILILSVFICTSAYAQKGNSSQSRWHADNKVGANDYQQIRKSELWYYLSNDKDNFYIDLKISDRKVQNRILDEGMTIWINMDGKPVKNLGVRYPMGAQNVSLKNRTHTEIETASGDTLSSLSKANTIELIGFINESERHFSSENLDNFRGSVRIDKNGILYYKMVMPIAKLPVRNSREGNGAMPFSIGFEYGSQSHSSNLPAVRSPETKSELYWINQVRLATSK